MIRAPARMLIVVVVACFCASPLLLTGCGKGGPSRYTVSGAVTYGGKPVPKGRIYFQPDEGKGNSGLTGTAIIENGQYRTKSGEGPVSGPQVVIVRCFNGIPHPEEPDETPMGMPLCNPFKTYVEIPQEAFTQDFHVPRGSSR